VERGLFLILGLFFSLSRPALSNCTALLKTISDSEREQKHQEILTDLESGTVTSARTGRANQNAHDLWFIELHNPATGRTRNAVMKPREWGDSNGWARSPMELVAYRFNRLLGLDYVPPTVYRYQIPVLTDQIAEAPLIYYVPRASVLYETPEASWGRSKAAIQSDNRILNVLLHNSDAHFKNLLLGEHWAEETLRPVFIDFGASLRPGTHVSMTHYPAKNNSEPVSQVRRNTLEALKNLNKEQLLTLSTHLSEQEISGILKRRDGIISYFERLVQKQGTERIILEE